MLAIETDDLTKRFKRLHRYRDVLLYPWVRREIVALREVSLEVARGELYGILGQNGAGKSTLLRILCTTLLPSEGTARVDGIDVVQDPRRVRRRIALVPAEERSFYWRLTGRQNLDFFATLYHLPSRAARVRIDRLLHDLDLQDEAGRPFQSLSTGTRQKFAIIRALMVEPAVLVLDEPTRSLDPISAESVRRFIREHVVEALGTTVVMATHSLHEAEALCTRLAFLRQGEITAEGTPAELRRRLGQRLECQIVLRHMPEYFTRRLEVVEGVRAAGAARVGDEQHLSLELTGSNGTLKDVLRIVTDSDAELVRFSMQDPSLEEVYLRTLASAESDLTQG